MGARRSISTSEQTRYRVSLCRNMQEIYCYGFTAQKSRAGILKAMTGHNVLHLLTATELAEIETFKSKYDAATGMKVSSCLSIRFTETERQSALMA